MNEEVKYIKDRKENRIAGDFVTFDINQNADQSLFIVKKRETGYITAKGEKPNENPDGLELNPAEIMDADSKQSEEEKEIIVSAEVSNGYVYAEEIEDDEDDIYRKDAKDIALIKEKHREFSEIAADIDNAVKSYGFESKVGLSLLSAMQFTRLLLVDVGEDKISPFFEAISNKNYILDKEEFPSINLDTRFHEALSDAKSHPDRPVFVYVKKMKSEDVMTYFKPVYDYIDNPEGDSYIAANGKTFFLAKNIYIMFSLEEGEDMTLIPRRLLRYVSVLDMKLLRSEEKTGEPCFIYLSQIKTSLIDHLSVQLREDSWKKIDQLVNAIGEVNGYVLQNKIINRLENAATVLLSSEIEEEEVLDMLLSRNLIRESIITKDKKAMSDKDILQTIDSYFGADRMMVTKEIIRSYLGTKQTKKGRSKKE